MCRVWCQCHVQSQMLRRSADAYRRQAAIACVIIKTTHIVNNNIMINLDIIAHINAIPQSLPIQFFIYHQN
jgi:hypothetical protein